MPIGILTDRDIALSVDRLGSPAANLHDVLEKMQSHGIRRLPVINDRGGLEGILTFDDVVELLSEELTDLARLVVKEQKRERTSSVNVSLTSSS